MNTNCKVIIPPSMRREFKAMLYLTLSELFEDPEEDIPFSELPLDWDEEGSEYDL